MDINMDTILLQQRENSLNNKLSSNESKSIFKNTLSGKNLCNGNVLNASQTKGTVNLITYKMEKNFDDEESIPSTKSLLNSLTPINGRKESIHNNSTPIKDQSLLMTENVAEEQESMLPNSGSSIPGPRIEMPNEPTENSGPSAQHQKYIIIKGICLIMCSALFFSISSVIVKYVADVKPGEMACIRFLGIILFTIPMLMESRKNPFGDLNLMHWLILRGIAGATSLYFRYSALQYLAIADATVIILSMPVFVFIFARIFLKEPFGFFHVGALAVTLFGITLVSKLSLIFGSKESETKNNGNQIFGILFALAAALVGSTVYVIIRKVKHLHHAVILFNFSWVAIIETSIITVYIDGFRLPEGGFKPWLLCLLAIFSFYGQILMTKALLAEEAGLVSVIRTSCEVIFAFIFQMTIFQNMPDKWSFFGTLLITISVLLTSSRKWVLTLPDDSTAKKLLWFVTK